MKKSDNLLQNICYILINPGQFPIIRYNNQLYYIIVMDGHYISFRFYNRSTINDLRGSNVISSSISIQAIMNILSGDLVTKDLITMRNWDLWITLEDFNKIRKIINERYQ